MRAGTNLVVDDFMMFVCYHQDILIGTGGDVAKQSVDYFSYLLRLWRTGEQGSWIASLEDPQTGEQRGFNGLDALFSFLRQQVNPIPDSNRKESGNGKS